MPDKDKKKKEKLMLLLEIRGKCTEYEYKLQKFESLTGTQGSLFTAMFLALESMDESISSWITDMGKLMQEYKDLHE